MSTYLQGVPEYIPQFQPFQPDLNFYANALQTKQNQYDSNYKALNNVYGQYFYADLTHGDNLKKKDELLKAIDFNLKRVSGLDLSLDQNVDQATQVFKPFYQDKHLMKDMAWTKNINSEKAYGAGLKNSRDEKQRSQYWDDGLKFLQYKTEEFKEASLEETMSMGNVSYTPYVNVIEKAQKIAKDQGYKAETITSTADGKWMVKTTNGENILEPLNRLLEAQLGSDPAVIDVYRTQAYINRKDYSYSNAAQFNGDRKAAEMSYLSESYKVLKTEADARKVELEKQNNVHDTKIDEVKKAVSTNNATPDTASYLERLQEAKNINTTLLTSNESNVSALSTQSGTATTSTGFENPYGDIESLRYKVDNAMASKLMQKDLGEAADLYARTHREVDYEANPYAVQAEAHNYRMQEVASANASRERAAKMTSDSTLDAAAYKVMYESGAYTPDLEKTVVGPDGKTYANPNYMKPVINPDADAITTIQKDRGNSSDKINLIDYAGKKLLNNIDDNVTPYLTQMLASMRDLKGQLSTQDIENVLGKGMTIDKFNEQLKAAPQDFVRKTLGPTKLKKITDSFQQLVKSNYNKGNGAFDIVGKNMLGYDVKLTDYYRYTNELQKWKSDVNQDVRNYAKENLPEELKGYINGMFDTRGNVISKDLFDKNHPKNNIQIGPGGRGKLIKVGGKDVFVTGKNINDVIMQEGRYAVENNTYKGQDIIDEIKGSMYSKKDGLANTLNPQKNYMKHQGKWIEVPDSNRDAVYKKIGTERLNNDFGQLSEVNFETGNAQIYDKLYKTIIDGFSSNRITKGPPGLTSYGQFKDAGLTTIGEHGTNVYTDAPNTIGAYSWRGFKQDLHKLNFDKDVEVRFNGPVQTGKNNYKEGKALIEAAFYETSMRGGALKGFRLASQPLAQNKAGKGAMIFYPDAEWLKKHTYTVTGEGAEAKKGPGIISQEMADEALQNGISFISDEKNWSNHLYQQTKVTPLESSVNFNATFDKPVVIDDPNDDSNMNQFIVQKDKILGGYSAEWKYKFYDPEQGRYVQKTTPILGITSGQQLEKERANAFMSWEEAKEASNELFNNVNR
jgi:D-ribose pyranose/furanose isomerase RbsD